MKHNLKHEYGIYLIVGLISAVLLLISIVIYKEYPTAGSFLKELSFAGFISLIVIFTVEKFTKQRHLDETVELTERINKNLFEAIYRRYIPDEIFREVERLLLTKDAFRRNYTIDYRMDLLPDLPESLQVTSRISFEIENLTTGKINHLIKASLENNLAADKKHAPQFLSLRIGEKQYTPNEIAKYSFDSIDQYSLRVPITLGPSESKKIDIVSKLVKFKHDNEFWQLFEPSLGLKLTLSGPEGITLQAASVHSKDAFLVQDGVGTKTWEINEGMLPGQGLLFWWNLK